MRMSIPVILAIAFGDLLAAPARAQGPEAPATRAPTVSAVASPAVGLDAAAGNAFGPAVATDALDAMRGGTDSKTITTNISDVDGSTDGNTAINNVTGGNLVDGGAFGHAAGLSTVIQNSGNNVLIQNSTVVNVQFVPSP